MKLYLARHGETTGNVGKFFQSSSTPLTKLGIMQAKLLAKRLRSFNIDLIYSSPLDRAKKTSEIISKKIHAPIEYWKELEEFKRPSELSGVLHNDPKAQKIIKIVTKNYSQKKGKFSDEENFYDLEKRSVQIIKHLTKNHSTQNVLCVSHAGFIKFLVCKTIFANKLTPEISNFMVTSFSSENTGISILHYDQNSKWKLLAWNDTSHL